MAKINIAVLSRKKKHHGIAEFTARKGEEVYCFFYDEDVFWFDYGVKRFGLPFNKMLEIRKAQLAELDEGD